MPNCYAIEDLVPVVDSTAYVHPTAVLIGDVIVGPRCYVGPAACLRGDLAAAVLFFPSQPVFHELGPKTPVHPMDLLWQLTCPTLFLYGDQDQTMAPERLEDLRSRIDAWDVDLRNW